MVNIETIQEVVLTILDTIVLVIRILYAILEAIYRKVQPSPDAPVSSEIVLITGGAQGIGKELAKQYGYLGANVVCVDVNKDLNEKTVAELKKQGIKASAYSCDVTNRQDVFALQKKIKQEIGDVSILVNNAGIMPCKRLLDHTEEDIKRVFNINLIAHFWTLEAFLPAMMDRNHGHIVALSSIAGLEGYPNVVPYNATKFGVRGLMEGLAEEFRHEGRAIKCTTICPFMVDTGLCKKPIIRFNTLLGMLEPKVVAETIIKAQRQGKREISIPSYVRLPTFLLKMLPVAANDAFHDYMRTGLEVSDP